MQSIFRNGPGHFFNGGTWRWAVTLLFAVAALRCGGADTPPAGPGVPEVQLSLSPSNPQIAQETAQQFMVRGLHSNGHVRDLTQTVKWTVTGEGKGSLPMPVDGLLSLQEPGRYQVSAEYQGRTLTTELTVTAATLKSVSLSPIAPQVPKGLTQAFTAMATFSDGSTQDITKLAAWSVKDVVGTAVISLGSTGVATARNLGTALVSVSYKTFSASTTLKVTAATLTTLSLSPFNPTIAKGTSQRFKATGTFSDGIVQDVSAAAKWTVTDVVGSGVAAIDGSGTAVGGSVGQAAVSAAYLGRVSRTNLTVTPAAVVSLTLGPTAASIAKGTKQQFTATATLSDGSRQDVTSLVTWTATDLMGTGVASIDGAGLALGKAVGQATLGGVYKGLSAAVTLTVTPAVLTSLAVTPAGATLVKGTYQGFSAVGTFSDGTTQDLTQLAVWSVSDLVGTDVVSIQGLSFQEIVFGKNVGQASLRAAYMSKAGSSTLTVVPVKLSGLYISALSSSVIKGDSRQFTATGGYTDGSSKDLTTVVSWTAMDIAPATGVATISAGGLATAKQVGYATITVSYLGLTASTTMTVIAVSSLAVSPLSSSITKKATSQFTATGTYTDGSTADLTSVVSWTATDIAPATGVATISASGLLTGNHAGQATITASYLALSASTVLTVSGWSLSRPGVSIKFGVWGTDSSNIWTLMGAGSWTVNWNGTAWTGYPGPYANDLYCIWGNAANDIWAAGLGGAITHWNGSTWNGVPGPPLAIGYSLRSLWGSDTNNVWVVGDHGTIDKWNGFAWAAQSSSIVNSLNSIWGSDANNVWAVGASGTILKWNGSVWTAQPSGTMNSLYGVWGSDANNVWAVGASGTILKWNGSVWTAQPSGSINSFQGIWGSDASNIWAVGTEPGANGVIVKWDGSTWTTQFSGAFTSPDAIWGLDANNVWVVGLYGELLQWQP